jgi:23S rRNA (adenine2030-N6)-methyltransferase
MNYRHNYHAGNFSDVIKHITLIVLIDLLLRKKTPFYYLDTHAGTGCYNLTSEWANKTKEYMGGIKKIIQQPNPPPTVLRYVNYIETMNRDEIAHQPAAKQTVDTLCYYPGSPLIANHFSRDQDRIVACELQLQQYQALKTNVHAMKKISIHHMDGFLSLKAFLPPLERRGLVFIDPPYEHPDEFKHITHFLSIAIKRWDKGIYAVWYPLKEKIQINHFYRTLKTEIQQPMLGIELTIYPDLPNHLNGCGLIIINPPWLLDETIKALLPWLWNALTINQQGDYRCFLLNY